MRKLVELICETCGQIFSRRANEVKRNVKKGRRVYCSLKCSANSSINIKHIKDVGKPYAWTKENSLIYSSTDEFSPFRLLYRSMNKNKRGINCRVALADLKNIWEKQNGICHYTGWGLKLPRNMKFPLGQIPEQASVDRIDSKKDYALDNIHFIAYIGNLAKNSFSEMDLFNFCYSVVNPKISPENSIAFNGKDEYSPFKILFGSMKRHSNKRKVVFVTLEDLKKQWDKQGGICPYTGWNLKLPNCNGKRWIPFTPDKASVDRIDSSRGYLKDNIQFVSCIANYAKFTFSEEQLYEFCEAVTKHRKISSCI